jgi:hypothetical protein
LQVSLIDSKAQHVLELLVEAVLASPRTGEG